MNAHSQLDMSSIFSPSFQEYFCLAQYAQKAVKSGPPETFHSRGVRIMSSTILTASRM